MNELVTQAEWPAEWFGLSTWMFVDNPLNLTHENGSHMHVIGGVLKNGTNLLALTWEGGQNIARLDADHDWMLEERIDPRAPKHARQFWREIIKSLAENRRECEAMSDEEARALAVDTFRSPSITWIGDRLDA